MANELIVVIYDSITNSVFESQVAKPLSAHYQEYSHIIIVSFEVQEVSANVLKLLQENYPRLKFVLYKRCIFFGRISLLGCVFLLRTLLKNYSTVDFLARGPQAGFIAYWARRKNKQEQLIIQARGLLAQEYLYINQQQAVLSSSIMQKICNLIKEKFVKLRAQQYYRLEQYVYTLNLISIEAVSSALEEYLVKKYNAYKNNIIIATKDIPAPLPAEQIYAWRTEIRDHLGISATQKIYCYSGSAKAWQCTQETIAFFKQLKHDDNAQNFLLILTYEKELFNQLLISTGINKSSYAVVSVPPTELFKYLAACDYGIIFRKPHIINWVSRPTKILEYKAVSVPIIHNNTIAMIKDK